MCGRYVLPNLDALAERWAMDGQHGQLWFDLTYNVPPGVQVPMVREENGRQRLTSARWGLIPSWWTQETPPSRTFNARSEEVASKPLWRDSFRHRRCLVPARGWYEWDSRPKTVTAAGRPVRQPYFIHCPGEDVIAFAGLWSVRQKAGREPERSCTVLTKTAAPGLASIHTRMPVVLRPADYGPWLGAGTAASTLAAVLANAREDMDAYPVGPQVGNVRCNGPERLERAVVPEQLELGEYRTE